jgi:hypothetical protein
MAESQLPVEHLCTITADTKQIAIIQGGPQGTRVHVAVTFAGAKLRGNVAESGGDWVTVRADGSIKLDVRITLLTDDGAPILVTYNGVGTRGENGLALRTAPLFETGDERYSWLNNVQAVGVGQAGEGSVTYDLYALS